MVARLQGGSKAFLVGLTAAGAVLAAAPIASADDPAQDCSEQPPPPPDGPQQQCQQQGPGLPNLPNGNNNGNRPPQNPPGVDVSDKSCTMVDGVPTLIPPEGLGLVGQHDIGPPCFYVFGVTPH